MKKYWLAFASVLMIVVGLIRGKWGVDLLIDGDKLALMDPITASAGTLKTAGIFLIIICVMLVSSGLILTVRRFVNIYIYCWISLGCFLVYGFINGFMLFGHPLAGTQFIDLGICIVTGLFLVLGKDSIKPKQIQSYEH